MTQPQNLSIGDLLSIIGQKEVELVFLRARVQELIEQLRQAQSTSAPTPPSD